MNRRLAAQAIGLGLLALLLFGPSAVASKPRAGYIKGVSDSALIAAAKATSLKLIDYDQVLCRNDRTVETWLKELTAGEARAIVWSAGPCRIVDQNPIDSGGEMCAQATILLKHPLARDDQPVMEIDFDKPIHGRPSPAYAFRAIIREEGLIRFRQDFEANWLARYPANAKTINCPDEAP